MAGSQGFAIVFVWGRILGKGHPTLLRGRGDAAGVYHTGVQPADDEGCVDTGQLIFSFATSAIEDRINRGELREPLVLPVTVSEDELDTLVYSVDVLAAPEPIDSMDELDTSRYGVIVSRGMRRGLLLPNLEGIDTPQKQVEIALQKAGIGKNETYDMERFEVVRHQ